MLVHAENLGHWFDPEIRLFQGLTFDIDAGGIIGLSGPSGSGKSTVLTILAGWLRPAEGEVTTEVDVSCTWIPQNPYGVARRTALEHVLCPRCSKARLARRRRPGAWRPWFGSISTRPPNGSSSPCREERHNDSCWRGPRWRLPG